MSWKLIYKVMMYMWYKHQMIPVNWLYMVVHVTKKSMKVCSQPGCYKINVCAPIDAWLCNYADRKWRHRVRHWFLSDTELTRGRGGHICHPGSQKERKPLQHLSSQRRMKVLTVNFFKFSNHLKDIFIMCSEFWNVEWFPK